MINIVVDNYIKVSGLPLDSFNAVVSRLTYPNPEFVNALKYGQGKVWGKERTISSFVYNKNRGEIWLPKGYYMEFLAEVVGKSQAPYQIIDQRVKTQVKVPKLSSPKTLRSYQAKMIDQASSYPGPAFIMQAPPGSGKTFTGLEFARQLGKKTLWVTHTTDLANQTRSAAADLFNIKPQEIGLIGQGKFYLGDFLTIATVQTLHRRKEETSRLQHEFGTIVVDEVHHAPANTWKSTTHMFSPETTLGLTATSYRNDGLTGMLFDCMGPVVAIADPALLQQEGVLVIPSVYMVETGLQFSGIHHPSLLSSIVENNPRNDLIINIVKYLRRDPNSNNTVLVLSDRVSHVETLYECLTDAGLNPLKKIGGMTKLNKALADEKLRSFQPKLITATYKLLSEGFDYPPINFVIFATPFKDSVRIEQCLGRAQRTCEGKDSAYIIDLVDINPVLQKQSRTRNMVYQGLGLTVRSAPPSVFYYHDSSEFA